MTIWGIKMALTNAQALRTLGFKESDKPTAEQLKAAYRKKALLTHPDKLIYPANADSTQKEKMLKAQTAAFQQVGEAYHILTQPQPKPAPTYAHTYKRQQKPRAANEEFTFEDAMALFNSLSRNQQIGVVIAGSVSLLLYSAFQYWNKPTPSLNAKREVPDADKQSDHHPKKRRFA